MNIRSLEFGLTVPQKDGSFKKLTMAVDVFPNENADEVYKELEALVTKRTGAPAVAGNKTETSETPATTPRKSRRSAAKEEVETEAKPEKTTKKTSRRSKKKETPFNREEKSHRNELSKVLTEHNGCKVKDLETSQKEFAKNLSEELSNDKIDLLDADGTVLQSFTDEVVNRWNKEYPVGDDDL